MENIITIIALATIAVIVIGFLTLLEKKHAATLAQYEERVKAWGERQDEEERRERLEKLDTYNQACNMEPFCGDAHTRSREAVAKAQEAARRAQQRIEFRKEQERKAQIRQHNSTFRALGMTPRPVFDPDPWFELEKEFQQKIEDGLQEEREKLLSGKP